MCHSHKCVCYCRLQLSQGQDSIIEMYFILNYWREKSVSDPSSSLSSTKSWWWYRGQALTDILSKLKSFWGKVQENMKGREGGRKNFTWVTWIPNDNQTSLVLMPLLFSLHHPCTLIVKLPPISGQFTTALTLSPDESISIVCTSWFVVPFIFLSLLVCQVTRQVDIGECEPVGTLHTQFFSEAALPLVFLLIPDICLTVDTDGVQLPMVTQHTEHLTASARKHHRHEAPP